MSMPAQVDKLCSGGWRPVPEDWSLHGTLLWPDVLVFACDTKMNQAAAECRWRWLGSLITGVNVSMT